MIVCGILHNNLHTISVTPFPARLSARSLVSLLSLYGMWTPLSDFFWELSCAMQYPRTIRLLLMLLASSRVLPSLRVFLVISDPAYVRRRGNQYCFPSRENCQESFSHQIHEVDLSVPGDVDALVVLAGGLLLRVDVDGQDGVRTGGVLVHVVGADGSVLEA